MNLDERQTKEAQYSELLDVKNQVGIASFGLMSNQVWYDDPRRLTFLLSRYKFVSKMLSGKAKVAEVGCGDAFGARIVQQEVKELHVYDFDPIFIDDINSRQVERWKLHAHLHDILTGPLEHGPFDAIYSVDVMEHIEPQVEHIYLNHLKSSLTEQGVLIVGMPSLESQTYASRQSRIGHVNCKSGPALKATLEQQFHNVFLFSMNDEVVHTGFSPMAHYLFAICCGKK
ncbi:class I SAM-dependent methyltransferase [Schlesneria sp. T3-172]|uniref:class I SAM-dependent methyltransferase n=1 Tax=Schlesneria sphaerica TaxID=3373610 RepID=UPI0037C717C4